MGRPGLVAPAPKAFPGRPLVAGFGRSAPRPSTGPGTRDLAAANRGTRRGTSPNRDPRRVARIVRPRRGPVANSRARCKRFRGEGDRWGWAQTFHACFSLLTLFAAY